ncbi:hypothetical protein D3C87_1766830 [compost metagenome]
MEIKFNQFVILNIIDEFGFEFDKTIFATGSITINDPKYQSLPAKTEVSSGYLGVRECRYDLIPTDFEVDAPCILFLQQFSDEHKIFGSGIRVSIESLET